MNTSTDTALDQFEFPEVDPEKKSKIRKRLQIIQKKAQYLRDTNKVWSLECTNGNYELKSDKKWLCDKTYARNSGITMTELAFIRRVQSYVLKNEIYLNFDREYFSKDVRYMDVSPLYANSGFSLDDVDEIDLDQAYWETAFQVGAIDRDIYESGKKGTISKEARMIALGSLAKRIIIYTFRGRQMIAKNVRKANEGMTENIWFTICKRVADVMMEAKRAVGDDYVFYWVDGLYIRRNPKSLAAATEVFEKYGYQCKIKPIHRIDFLDGKFEVWDNSDSEKPRRFGYVKYRKKRPFREDPSLKSLCLKTLSGMDPIKIMKSNTVTN